MEVKESTTMEKNTSKPLTEQERKFAEENHNLIYGFLHTYGYSIEDFYNTAVFGYLRAVEVYHRKEKYKGNYNFSSVAYQYMRAEISNHLRMQNAKKRKPSEKNLSLESENIQNKTSEKSPEQKLMEAETLTEILESMTELQRKITGMKMDGYENKEIFLILDMSQSTYYKELQRIKAALSEKHC